jgi:N-acyl homoserine lactone hydrolase
VNLDDVRAIQYGDVLVDGERWPCSIHLIEHPDGRILVDTGMIDSTPELDAKWGFRFDASVIPRDVVCVINTHLHFDHCGGNRLFPGTPIHLQRAEREAARAEHYTIRSWVEFEGATYVEHDGEAEIVSGVRVLPTPGHTPGHQSVLVDTDDGLVVLAGDVGYNWPQFEASESGQLLLSLRPRRIWLAHQAEPRDATRSESRTGR